MNKRSVTYILDSVSGLLLILWMFLPIAHGEISSEVIYKPIYLPIGYSLLFPRTMYGAILYSIYLVPIWGIIKFATLFFGSKMGIIGRRNSILSPFLSIIATSIMLYSTLLPVIKFAENISYYVSIATSVQVVFGVVFLLNILYVTLFINRLNFKNKTYVEYRDFKIRQKKIKTGNRSKVHLTGIDFFFRIRSKLFFSFIGVISLIIIVLSSQLLGNYKETLTKAIGEGANNQVEQTSATYRINIGDIIAMYEYLKRQVEFNEKAEFKYNNLSIYSNLKSRIYLDYENMKLPEFLCEYSTLFIDERFPDAKHLSSEISTMYFKLFRDNKESFHIIEGDQYKYISAIYNNAIIKKGETKVRKERLLGFSVLTFDKDVIMKPYFKIRNLVIILTALFIYISIILIYIVGNYIVNPILFLRMNVRKISDVLALMINGESRVSSSALKYNDSIRSRDEIKFLSTEIKDLVTVIKGIIPYVSASTLKHAETAVTSSVEKDLTFIFTDIRGFTTLCEGMEPNEVVSILNKYLDIETEIILQNGGDVDKFVGDEMMAFFQGPDKELHACRAAMEIRHAMMEEKELREKEGLPVVNIGIGINSGPVVFGSVGARDRMDFTSIGDTVNLAARLEGANKAYGSKSIISESVYKKIKDVFLCRELDYITVKGKNKPVRIYEILQEHSKAKDILFEIKEVFETGLKKYREKNWDEALDSFREIFEKFNDTPSKIFIERINHFVKNPPELNWDGVFKMTIK